MTSHMQTRMLEAWSLAQTRLHCHNHCMWSLMLKGHLFDTHLYQFLQDILMPEDFKCFSLNHAACRTRKRKQNPAVPFCVARQHLLIVAWLSNPNDGCIFITRWTEKKKKCSLKQNHTSFHISSNYNNSINISMQWSLEWKHIHAGPKVFTWRQLRGSKE